MTGIKIDGTQNKVVLDDDADTYFEAATDDTIKVYVAGAQDFTITANTLTAESGSTIAAQALTATTGAFTGNVTITGTTPTLTIGDGDAEDSKIIFDGNAQDFHIGLDDTDDFLVLGKGTTLGTTPHIRMDEHGHVTKPLQPMFQANASYTNLPLTTQQTITLSERVDVNGDLASNTFTAPITGKYYLSYHFYLTSLDADHTALDVKIVTSNKTYAVTYKPSVMFSADANFGVTGSQVCDMDANDTATFVIYIAGGAAQTDVHADSTACGMLIG